MNRACFIVSLILAVTPVIAGDTILDLDALAKRLTAPARLDRVSVVNEFRTVATNRPLTRAETQLLLKVFTADPDWSVRVRACVLLPFAEDKTLVMAHLLAALKERDDDKTGSGNVPHAACRALCEIGDPQALPAIREWLQFLRDNPKKFKHTRKQLISSAEKWIRELETKKNEKVPTSASTATNQPALSAD